MSILFLFGAGASNGNPDCKPYPPPLGAKLFSDLQKESELAAKIDKTLCDLFIENFEKGMEKLWEDNPGSITPFQIDLAKYFTKFEAGKNNYYIRLIEIIKKSQKKAVLSTTNYDLLLEQSINSCGYSISYHGLPVNEKNQSLLKIHGSCNFLPDIDPKQISGIGFSIPRGGCEVLEAPIRPASAAETKRFCELADSIAPAIAVYAEGKQILHCGSFVENIQQQWENEVIKAKKIFVIGLRVVEHDEHLWKVLASCNAWLGYVGFEPEEFKDWAKKNRKKNAFIVANTFEESLPIIQRRIQP